MCDARFAGARGFGNGVLGLGGEGTVRNGSRLRLCWLRSIRGRCESPNNGTGWHVKYQLKDRDHAKDRTGDTRTHRVEQGTAETPAGSGSLTKVARHC